MSTYFKAAESKDASENWLICWTGTDADGGSWNVTTDHIHASELHGISQGAKADAELIARLLNEYYEKLYEGQG